MSLFTRLMGASVLTSSPVSWDSRATASSLSAMRAAWLPLISSPRTSISTACRVASGMLLSISPSF